MDAGRWYASYLDELNRVFDAVLVLYQRETALHIERERKWWVWR